ncbi:DUF3710 domain-containing protein [Streptomyces sp. MAR4 CNX-425]|uniref:DUF3710 domain-containing protein n=1 Tax=Streptomyces sp. MAR4 CNX-425 TaxID=3406343 RepID=UPI003B510E0A
MLLRTVIRDEGLSEAAVVELLSQARVEADDVLATGAWRRPRIRGVETGPWDVREAAEAGVVSVADRIDLGGLRLPVGAGGRSVELAPVRDAGLDIVGVRAESGATTLELQALHARSGLCWDEVRESAVAWLRHRGARVGEWLGPAGRAVRGWLWPERKSRWAVGSPRPVRVFGCDGPGWVLRALLTGEGAAPEGDGAAAWAYELFAGAVVNASGSGSASLATPGTPITLRWPW